MSRPRLFYVPMAAAFEVERVADGVDWADIASFDSPGAGAAQEAEPNGVQGVVDAGFARLEELGWDRYCVVGDSHGQAAAIEIALADPDRVSVIGISHAAAR